MKKLLLPITAAMLVLLIFGTIYLVTQQVLRSGANDPQIELAEDTAARISQGLSPHLVEAGPRVDIAASLAPFEMVYDSNHNLIASGVVLDGAAPVLPPGVLDAANRQTHIVTWQPKTGVRIAAVVVKSNDGYVLAGRSLREVEKRENYALYATLLGLIPALAVIAGSAWFWLRPK